MPTTFRPYQPDQGLLLPPDLRDWLPAGHLAHHVSDLVDGLDLRPFYARYAGDRRGGGRGQTSGEGPHGREAGDAGGTGTVRPTQMGVGGAQRVDRGSAR